MKKPIVILIARREILDLLRDRRTLMLILLLPAIIYPAFAAVGFLFASTLMGQKSIVGVVRPATADPNNFALAVGGLASTQLPETRWPALFQDEQFHPELLGQSSKPTQAAGSDQLAVRWLDSDDPAPLQNREVDTMLVLPSDFERLIIAGKKPEIRLMRRESDETSKLAMGRVESILGAYRNKLNATRFEQAGLTNSFDQPFQIVTPEQGKPLSQLTANELRDTLVKFLPLLIVMWTMAGALHPAIDLTAGEKERGTMETLLICPARRSEIVAGKFLAVFVFGYMSAIYNLMWMALGAIIAGFFLPEPILSFTGLAWTCILAIPLAMFFSSLALGLGAFARSTKEGQYYLLPIMLLVMPLSLIPLTPGIQLTPGLSMIPISGLVLILQNLLSVSGKPISALTWCTGLGSFFFYVWISLFWASRQFRRENVLFRSQQALSPRVRLKLWWQSVRNRQRGEI
ncbi:MAG: ABC transporter permease [Zavarzinella sp.]